jgi:hypothetical protein
MEYALNIDDVKIQNAMKALDIDPEELLIKHYEDFGGVRVAEHIQELRYNYYTRKLKDFVRQIKLKVRELRLKATMQETLSRQRSKSSTPDEVWHNWSQESTALIDTQNMRKRKLIQTAKLEQLKSKSLKAIEKINQREKVVKKRLGEISSMKRLENENRRKRHLDALEKIKNEQRVSQETMRSKLRKSMEEHHLRELKAETQRMDAVKVREKEYLKKHGEVLSHLEERERLVEEETTRGMQRYTSKVERSRVVHEREVRAVSEKAGRHYEDLMKASLNVDKHKRLLSAERKQLAYEKYLKLEEAATRRRETHQRPEDMSLKKARSMAAINRVKSERVEQMTKTKELEDRFIMSMKVLEERREARRIETELKHETHRLKEEDTKSKVRKKQRKQLEKQEQVLVKQKELSEKVQAWREERERLAAKNQEIAIQAMKEREKIASEILLIHKKS